MEKYKRVGMINLYLGFLNIASPILIYLYISAFYSTMRFLELATYPPFTLLKIMIFHVFIGIFNLVFAGIFYYIPDTSMAKYYNASCIYLVFSILFSLLFGTYIMFLLS